MPIDLSAIQSARTDKIGHFRFKKLDPETFLATNDGGRHAFFSTEEFRDFLAGKMAEGPRAQELLEKGFLKDQNYQKTLTGQMAEKNRFLAEGPVLHIVVTTLRCNHKCQYCHAAVAPMTAKELDMTPETALKTLDVIFHTPALNLTIEFQGGESLVNWPVVQLFVEEGMRRGQALQKNVSFALVSNLSLMDEEKMKWLLDRDVSISTSLDGDEETHNYNRTYKDGNSYALTVGWIKRINAEYAARGKRNSVGALLTVTSKVIERRKEVLQAYLDAGLQGIFLRPLNPYGFAAAEAKRLGYSTEAFVEFYHAMMGDIMEINRSGRVFREQMSAMYLTKILTPHDPNYLDERSPCGACIGQVAYSYDGKIYSCDEGRMMARMGIHDFQMGQVGESGKEAYVDMISSTTTKAMVQASTVDGLPGFVDDVYKPYIGVCPIHSFKTTGNLFPNYATDDKRQMGTAVLDYLFQQLRDPASVAIFESWLRPGEGPSTASCEIKV